MVCLSESPIFLGTSPAPKHGPQKQGFNTAPEDVEAIGAYLSALGIREAELLPFHRLGSAKYEAMGLLYAYRDQEPLSKEALEKIKENYKKYISVKIER